MIRRALLLSLLVAGCSDEGPFGLRWSSGAAPPAATLWSSPTAGAGGAVAMAGAGGAVATAGAGGAVVMAGAGGAVVMAGAGGAVVMAGAAGEAGRGGLGGAGAGGGGGGAAGGPAVDWTTCQADDAAWVRKALLALLGRRPESSDEVRLYVDLVRSIDQAAPSPAGAPLTAGRRAAALAMMQDPAYEARWIDAYRDVLRVQRVDEMANAACYGQDEHDDVASVARLVRDEAPDVGIADKPFTMRDVVRGALAIDDISPIFIGNLFSMLALTFPGANAPPDKLELARRSNFGAWFDAVYLHRDGVCLPCHNSEHSTTYDPDPARSRHFSLPGKPERALFGDPNGVPADGSADGIARMHGVLRFDGFVGAGEARPWGWSGACGMFAPRGSVGADIAGVNARFGAIEGDKASAWELSGSLSAGLASLRKKGLVLDEDGDLEGADEAFAYLLAASVAERVWVTMVGTPLTIANYFARNQAARDQLQTLTFALIDGHFSHKALVLSVLESPAFNLRAPDARCGEPYAMPALFDPWTRAETDEARRGNSAADGITPVPARTLLSSTYHALGWPRPDDFAFPAFEGDQQELQGDVGVFLKNAEPGFVGFDFQATLAFEERMGRCRKPDGVEADVVDQIIEAAVAEGATVGDAVQALADRLHGEPVRTGGGEQAALEALLGRSFTTALSALPPPRDPPLRRVCGAMLSAPQWLLRGAAPEGVAKAPSLLPPAARYEALCEALSSRPLPGGLVITCAPEGLTVKGP